MASIPEIKLALDITNATWANYISNGVIQKQRKNEYDVATVAKQIIRDKDSKIKAAKAAKSSFVVRENKMKKQLILLQNGNDDDSPEGVKKSLDIELQREKLVKLRHDNSVRKKEFMPIENVFTLVTSIASEFSAFLDPIVGKMKQSMPDMTARTHDELVKIMAVGRNNLARHIEGKTTNEFIHLFNPEASISGNEATDDT